MAAVTSELAKCIAQNYIVFPLQFPMRARNSRSQFGTMRIGTGGESQRLKRAGSEGRAEHALVGAPVGVLRVLQPLPPDKRELVSVITCTFYCASLWKVRVIALTCPPTTFAPHAKFAASSVEPGRGC